MARSSAGVAATAGTKGIKLSPSELIEKLIALIPPRSSPLLRYGGVFAPNFKRRDEIILPVELEDIVTEGQLFSLWREIKNFAQRLSRAK